MYIGQPYLTPPEFDVIENVSLIVQSYKVG